MSAEQTPTGVTKSVSVSELYGRPTYIVTNWAEAPDGLECYRDGKTYIFNKAFSKPGGWIFFKVLKEGEWVDFIHPPGTTLVTDGITKSIAKGGGTDK